MTTMTFAGAIEDVLMKAMADDERIVVFGEDVHALRMNLYAKFGEMRVRPTPISESAFLGAAVTAAMAGLRPVVEIRAVGKHRWWCAWVAAVVTGTVGSTSKAFGDGSHKCPA